MHYVDVYKDVFGVEPVCAQLQVAPSNDHARKARVPSVRSVTDAQLTETIRAVH